MEDHLNPAADEDTLVIPDSLRRRMYPRRGGPPGPAIKVDRSAVAAVRERFGVLEASKPLAGREDVEPDMAEAARDHLAGGANVRGAAVVGALLANGTRTEDVGKLAVRLADSWVSEHGLPFAARAFAELSQFVWYCPGVKPIEHRGGGGYCQSVASSGMAKGAARLRGLLAAASDDDHQEAVDGLAECRRSASQRVVVSFLVPDRHDWVVECLAAPPSTHHERDFWWMLYCSLGAPDHLDLLPPSLVHHYSWDRPCQLTMAEGVGTAVTPLLVKAFDADTQMTDHRKLLLETLAIVPGDEAFQAMVDRVEEKYVQPALRTAMKRFPVRALRLLASAVSTAPKDAPRGMLKLAALLAEHVRSHRDLAAEMRADLPADIRAMADATDIGHGALPDAPADVLPRPLVDPPWPRTAKAAKPAVIAGLTPPAEPAMRWAPGERERWARLDGRHGRPQGDDWDEQAAVFRSGSYMIPAGLTILVYGPEEKVRPLLAGWRPQMWVAEQWMNPIVARYGLDALPAAMSVAEPNPSGHAGSLLPFLDASVARLMTECLARSKTREIALAWFDRHGVDAVPLLVPAAVGKSAAPRREAVSALRLLAGGHGVEKVVEAAARAYGEAAGAVEAMLTVDPLDLLPGRIPEVGDWVDPHLLPRIRLRDREDALPAEATRHLLTMLAMSKRQEVYAGVGVVKELCDPESLAAFAWELFQQWQRNGTPAKDAWALAQLEWLGDDETVRRLTPVIRAWPGDGGHSKAVVGLDILAGIGTDVALMHLHGIAQKVRFGGLKARAQDRIGQVADRLGLTPDQLGDRLVPDFGLDAAGGMTLDYGPRRFLVGFDETLKPYVADESGGLRKSLPRPGAKDDQALAPAAYTRFAALKKDVRTVAADQIRRLEAAMVTRRRWTAGEFRRHLAEHPLIGHIVRRLVWVAEDGGRATAFRVAEDRTSADVHDDMLTPPESAAIGLAHPVELGESVAAWSSVFADYLILQPFPQLDRTGHALTGAERAGRRLERLQGVHVPGQALLALERRGWRRSNPMDAGIQHCLYREVPGGLYVNVKLNPGVGIGDVEGTDLEEIRLDGHCEDSFWSPGEGRPFADLDPVTASEVIAELTEASS